MFLASFFMILTNSSCFITEAFQRLDVLLEHKNLPWHLNKDIALVQ